MPPESTILLASADWQTRARDHHQRVIRHTHPAKNRRDRGLPHPILDFLFQYYPYSFGFLEKWHPGIGVTLESSSPPPHLCGPEYLHENDELRVDATRMPAKERQRLGFILELLESTRSRPANFACHGLHEWAMVYRGSHIRHEKLLSLRLPQSAIDRLVESRSICCSHHDAFRFFAVEARALNHLQPSLETRLQHEQPACLHANMDLYKWAAKSMPWVGSDLLLDCFELAVDLRDLDMRASPYDLTPWERMPVCIETPEGRETYEREQRELAERARPLRERLIAALRITLS